MRGRRTNDRRVAGLDVVLVPVEEEKAASGSE
jgi:hypothetical protein